LPGRFNYDQCRCDQSSPASPGFLGFGAATHIITQVCIWQRRRVFAFTRSGDVAAQDFARSVGAVWAGGSDQGPPERLNAAIIFARVEGLMPIALRAVNKGGRVGCGGIHVSDIPQFPYRFYGRSDRSCPSQI
jgi:alcohol dehydrogenase, propanol-preferring